MKTQAYLHRTCAALVALLCTVFAVGLTAAMPFSETDGALSIQTASKDTTWLSYHQLVEDLRQLATEIETTHPDPYTWGGGKIAFHRRLHHLLRSLPEQGMDVAAFHELLLPLVAAIQDGHTYLLPLEEQTMAFGTGLPIRFKVVAEDVDSPLEALFVEGMSEACGVSLLGAQLMALEGVPFATILERQKQWKGYGNTFGNLRNLIYNLQTNVGLRQLIPEWENGEHIRASFLQPHASEAVHCELALGGPPQTWDGEGAETMLHLPESPAGVPTYSFLDDDRAIALLRLDNTWAYREYFEPGLEGTVSDWMRAMGEHVYRQYHGVEKTPEDFAEVVAGVPAATEILAHLVEAMSDAGTQTLLVDLRHNTGGSSTIVDMLLYFLGGRAGWAFMNEMYSIDRMDEAPLDTTTNPYPFQEGDYNFQNENNAREGKSSGNEAYYLRVTPTFAKELRSNAHEGYYRPPNLVVATSPITFSGGFWVEAVLAKLGATIVGVPSGQEGNHFANTVRFTLNNSGITAGVSSKFFVMFPNDPDGLRVFPVHEPLTYERWASFGFDPNASLLLALETIPQRP